MITAPELLSETHILITAVKKLDQNWNICEPWKCGNGKDAVVMIKKNGKKYYITIRDDNAETLLYGIGRTRPDSLKTIEDGNIQSIHGCKAVTTDSLCRLLSIISILQPDSPL